MYRSIALLVSLAALPLAGGLAAGATSTAAAAGTHTLPRLLSCAGTPLLRPRGTVVLSCADANSEFRATRWLSWTATAATGRTDFGVNLCTPTCVASRIRYFAGATVRLSEPRATAKGLLFSRAVITYRLSGETETFTAYPAT